MVKISTANGHVDLRILSKGHPQVLLVTGNPLVMSNSVMNVAPPNLSNKSSTLGIGNGPGIVTAFSFLKSVQNQFGPSGLGTNKIGAAHALSHFSMIPCANKLSISLSTIFNFSGFSR